MAIIADDKIYLQPVPQVFPGQESVQLSMLRLDLVHPVISGNKWFKFKFNLHAAVSEGYGQVITFGGAYSNHLVATAGACKEKGLKAIGIVRGLHAAEREIPTLQACIEMGMRLHFVSREAYDRKGDPDYLNNLQHTWGRSYIIPEGGANEPGRVGAGTIARFIPEDATHICLPVGTGTTLAGLRNALPVMQELTGFTAMKGGAYLKDDIEAWLHPAQNTAWHLEDSYHFGGFAKAPEGLKDFIRSFRRSTGIPLDIVYTGKMVRGVADMLSKSHFPEGSKIICIHTGGLQGNPVRLFD